MMGSMTVVDQDMERPGMNLRKRAKVQHALKNCRGSAVLTNTASTHGKSVMAKMTAMTILMRLRNYVSSLNIKRTLLIVLIRQDTMGD